jgi:hypothetical protein
MDNAVAVPVHRIVGMQRRFTAVCANHGKIVIVDDAVAVDVTALHRRHGRVRNGNVQRCSVEVALLFVRQRVVTTGIGQRHKWHKADRQGDHEKCAKSCGHDATLHSRLVSLSAMNLSLQESFRRVCFL